MYAIISMTTGDSPQIALLQRLDPENRHAVFSLLFDHAMTFDGKSQAYEALALVKKLDTNGNRVGFKVVSNKLLMSMQSSSLQLAQHRLAAAKARITLAAHITQVKRCSQNVETLTGIKIDASR